MAEPPLRCSDPPAESCSDAGCPVHGDPADWSGHGHGAGVVGCPDCDELDDDEPDD